MKKEQRQSTWHRFGRFLKHNICGLIGFTLCYIVPLIVFGTIVKYTNVANGIYIAFWGYVALIIAGIIVWKKLKEKVLQMKHSALRGILLSIFSFISWGLVFGLIYFMMLAGVKLYNYWLSVGACLLLGRIFYILNEISKTEI